jgi:hypothetical protein
MSEKLAVSRKVAVSMMFDTVRIDVVCGDGYEATVLYDDLVDRLKAGEGITIALDQGPSPQEPTE